MKAFVSWSGGKESTLALFRARRAGIEATVLVNVIDLDGERSRGHGVRAELLRSQARALHCTILQPRADWEGYEAVFKQTLRSLVSDGVRVGIFGDINFEPHREWVERVCSETSVEPLFPLWGSAREVLIEELSQFGFRALVCSLDTTKLPSSLLGKIIDERFIEELSALEDIDLCGEAGEYHTLVTDGPLFRKELIIEKTTILIKQEHSILDILSHSLGEK